MAKILITGGSGLLGSEISRLLLERGDEPVFLSRSAKVKDGIKYYKWDLEKSEIDLEAFKDVESVIHLAGAGVMAKAWTKSYKAEIISSRVKGAQLIYNTIVENNLPIKQFVGASAVGFYGIEKSEADITANNPAGTDFLAKVCTVWEATYVPFSQRNIKTCSIRLGIILDKKSGALPPLAVLSKFGLASATGSGNQYFPWIHVEDAARIFIYAITQNEVQGAYNAVASEVVNNKTFMKTLAKNYGRCMWLPNLPVWLLRLVLGERYVALTTGLKINNQKLIFSGFKFKFPNLKEALHSLK